MYVIFLKSRGFKDFKYDMDMADMDMMDMDVVDIVMYYISSNASLFFIKKWRQKLDSTVATTALIWSV